MEDEGKKQASSPQGRLNLASYVLLFQKNTRGNPAEKRAGDGRHLNKPGFECGSPAVLQCGNCFKSPKMTTTEPHDVFTSFLLTFPSGSRSVSGTTLPFGCELPVASRPSAALHNFKARRGSALWPANYKPIRSASFWLTGKRTSEIGRVSLSLSSCANILTCLSI